MVLDVEDLQRKGLSWALEILKGLPSEWSAGARL